MNILFDLDGTLADPLNAFDLSLNHALKTLNLPLLSQSILRTMIGPPMHMVLPQVLGENSSRASEVMDVYRAHHGAHGLSHYEFYPLMEETLSDLKRQHRLFLATSKPLIFARAMLEQFGKLELFDEIHGSELSGALSDKTELIRSVLQENALAPADTIMVGDRKFDILGARNNWITAVGVTWGYGSKQELQEAGADFISESWVELKEFIRRTSDSKST